MIQSMVLAATFFLPLSQGAFATPCEDFSRLGRLPTSLAMEEPTSGRTILAIAKRSSSAKAHLYDVRVVRASRTGHRFPSTVFPLVIQNFAESDGSCRGGFVFADSPYFFENGRISIGKNEVIYRVYNSNACAGYFCRGKEVEYRLR